MSKKLEDSYTKVAGMLNNNRANIIVDTPLEVAAVKAQKFDPIDTPEEIEEFEENQRLLGP